MLEREDLPPKRDIGYAMGANFFQASKQSAKENRMGGLFSRLRLLIKRLNNHIYQLTARHLPIPRARVNLHRKRGVNIGKGVQIGPMVILENPFPNAIYIDDLVAISPGVTVVAHTKPPFWFKNKFPSYVDPVLIKRGVWVGVNVTILPGVTIGENSIVTPGSVVSKDVPPNTVVRGNPAEVVAKL